MPLTTHFEDELIETYAMGRLAGTEAALLEEHLLVCEGCQERLEQMDDFIRAFRIAAHSHAAPAAAKPQRARRARPGALERWLRAGWRPMRLAGAMATAALAVVMIAPRQELRQAGTAAGGEAAAPAVTAALSAQRGSGGATIAAGRQVDLRLDATGLEGEAFRVEVADARGRAVWSANGVSEADGQVPAKLDRPLAAGGYWVRLYDARTGGLVREFGLQAR